MRKTFPIVVKYLLPAALLAAVAVAAGAEGAGSWYFAVSGDSRDCGDLIVPKIAAAIAREGGRAPAEFYWHLGDFRRLFDVDCDIAKRADPGYDCAARPVGSFGSAAMDGYLSGAWPDFIANQVLAFGTTPVFLGIGNHEVGVGRTRDDYRRQFQRWLTQEPIHRQRTLEATTGFYSNEGDTYYHFILHGVDFISLDNADDTSFSAAQIAWLEKVLARDAADPAVSTLVAAMHEALPYSASRGHAMDASCQGLCSGQQVYGLLFRAQGLAGPPEKRKHVYVFASHAHLYAEDIFNQPEHAGQVLPGWLIGTAGAEQYSTAIRYGYLEVEVHADGTLEPRFREVTRDMPPAGEGAGAESLADYCFTKNLHRSGDSALHAPCACGAAAH
jgi:hypothetical protein